MKSTTALLALAGALVPHLATAQGSPPVWEPEPERFRPLSTFNAPLQADSLAASTTATAPQPFPYRPWTRGERGRYEPSTLAIYQVKAAPPNNCGPALFEIVNRDPDEAPCVAIQRTRRWKD